MTGPGSPEGGPGPRAWRAGWFGGERNLTAPAGPVRRYPRQVLHWLFTALMVLVVVLTTWFAGYVVFRLFADQR
ncbi:hypothetical protein SAMN05444320_101329 [Streptoalloteichus hindustanus]|uniref:Uncharacterized protein n=1 Tax=Streptoalloteichus hindustanus TaxID=2017 RepID=A0A1M4U874_STRHI|nr:hypothetical protein SAMN05444320_101329 [Streptoalloteichus hindustanus]